MRLKSLKSELLLLKHKLHQFRFKNQTLKLENQSLATPLQVIISENKALTQELAELKDKLNINSTNSAFLVK
jgi:regulator of replication initiation timing